MANKYYAPGPARSERVSDLFSAIAPRYNLLNDLQSFGLHRRWKNRLVRMADPRPGERALDLCCGTGDIARLLARRAAAVVGLDFSEPMLIRAGLRFARSNALLQPSTGTRLDVALCRADALALPFADASFDIVTVGYGLRNLPDWPGGLEQMWRVTKPGGRILVLDFGKPSNRLWRLLYFAYLSSWVPLLGRIFCGDAQAYAYILDSLRHYPAQSGVAGKLKALGDTRVQEVNLLGGAMSIHFAKKPPHARVLSNP